MRMLGGERISRLAVGIFALVLTGGLAAFFTGYLDPFIGSKEQTASKPAMPFAKPALPNPGITPAVNATTAAAVVPAIPAASAPVQVKTISVSTLPTVISATNQATVTTTNKIGQPLESSVKETKPIPKKTNNSAPKQARSRNLDLRHCLDLATEMEIAQCAYKLP